MTSQPQPARIRLDLTTSLKVECEKDILCCKYSPNKEFIIGGDMDGIIRVYKSSDGTVVHSLVGDDITHPVTSLQVKKSSHSPHLLSTYTDGKVRIWHLEDRRVLRDIKEDRQTLGSIYHPKLNKFMTLGDNGALYLYNEETGQREQSYEKGTVDGIVDGHTSRIFAATFHPQQQMEFVSGGWDNVVHFWDMRQPNSTRYIKDVYMCGEGLDISKNGRELLTCSHVRENALQLWHYQQGRLLTNIEPDLNKCKYYCGQWVTSEAILVGGTDPNILKVVSLRTLTTIMHYKGTSTGVYCLDHFSKSGKGSKKDHSNTDIKVAYSVDKFLIQSDFTV